MPKSALHNRSSTRTEEQPSGVVTNWTCYITISHHLPSSFPRRIYAEHVFKRTIKHLLQLLAHDDHIFHTLFFLHDSSNQRLTPSSSSGHQFILLPALIHPSQRWSILSCFNPTGVTIYQNFTFGGSQTYDVPEHSSLLEFKLAYHLDKLHPHPNPCPTCYVSSCGPTHRLNIRISNFLEYIPT